MLRLLQRALRQLLGVLRCCQRVVRIARDGRRIGCDAPSTGGIQRRLHVEILEQISRRVGKSDWGRRRHDEQAQRCRQGGFESKVFHDAISFGCHEQLAFMIVSDCSHLLRPVLPEITGGDLTEIEDRCFQ
ncbi:MAG TPA: hypothetical protein VE397_10690 [Stellaceae bacterium]|nr:hypothetical protein [Stellaceae bacterium]